MIETVESARAVARRTAKYFTLRTREMIDGKLRKTAINEVKRWIE